MTAPSRALLDALSGAISRRATANWPSAATAQAAFAVIAADAKRGPRGKAAPSGYDDIVRYFGLGDDERRVLEAAGAAEHSTALHLLFGLLSGDQGPARPTAGLALELAGLPPTDDSAHRFVGELSNLVRLGLITTHGDDVLLSRRLRVPDRVAAHLAGNETPVESVLPLLQAPVPVDVPEAAVLADALTAGERFVWVQSPAGGAGTALAAAACQKLDVPCLVADLRRLRPDDDARGAATALLLEAGLSGAVLVLAGAERMPAEVLERAATPVVAVSTEQWDTRWSPALPPVIMAPRLTLEQRARLWRPVLGGAAVDREVAALRLAPEQIVAVGRHARRTAELYGERDVGLDRIRSSARQLGRGRTGRASAGASTIDDLVLPQHVLDEVRRLLDWARYRDEVVALGPLHGRGGKGTGICALFSGPPGTGKTLAAHVIADSLAMDLYQVELAGVVDKYIGETEKNLERVFQEAEAMNAVLFFDEADALFGSRSEVRDARDRYANQEIAYLLQRMEQFDGITVLASNLRGNIDPAFARRLHFIISFPEPDEPTRRALWGQHLAGIPADPADPVDVDWLAHTVELSGGDVRNIVLSATYAAVAGGEPIGMRHVTAAVRREYIKLGRRVPAEAVDDHDHPVGASRARSRS